MDKSRKHNYLKMYTPRTPSPVITAIAFVFFQMLSFHGISQQTKHILVEREAYENSLMIHYGLKYDLANYSVKETKKKWWYWLPNVGFTFGLPHVSLNTNQLAVFDKQNEERKLKQLELHQQYKIQFNENLQMLSAKYRLIELKLELEKEEKEKFVIKESIYKIEQSAFEKGGSIPIEKLKADLVFKENKSFLHNLEREIEGMILDLELFSFYKLEIIRFREDFGECILESKVYQK